MKKLIYALIAASLLWFAGCATGSKDTRILYGPDVQGLVKASPVVIRVNSSGFTEGQTTLTSRKDYSLAKFRYRVDWVDSKGFAIRSVTSSWTDFSIPPRGVYNIRVVAPTREAANFTIYIEKSKH